MMLVDGVLWIQTDTANGQPLAGAGGDDARSAEEEAAKKAAEEETARKAAEEEAARRAAEEEAARKAAEEEAAKKAAEEGAAKKAAEEEAAKKAAEEGAAKKAAEEEAAKKAAEEETARKAAEEEAARRAVEEEEEAARKAAEEEAARKAAEEETAKKAAEEEAANKAAEEEAARKAAEEEAARKAAEEEAARKAAEEAARKAAEEEAARKAVEEEAARKAAEEAAREAAEEEAAKAAARRPSHVVVCPALVAVSVCELRQINHFNPQPSHLQDTFSPGIWRCEFQFGSNQIQRNPVAITPPFLIEVTCGSRVGPRKPETCHVNTKLFHELHGLVSKKAVGVSSIFVTLLLGPTWHGMRKRHLFQTPLNVWINQVKAQQTRPEARAKEKQKVPVQALPIFWRFLSNWVSKLLGGWNLVLGCSY